MVWRCRCGIWLRKPVKTAAAEIENGGGKAMFLKVNVANQAEVESAVKATLEKFGRIDILINNAGIVRDAQLIKVKDGVVTGKMSEAEFDLGDRRQPQRRVQLHSSRCAADD